MNSEFSDGVVQRYVHLVNWHQLLRMLMSGGVKSHPTLLSHFHLWTLAVASPDSMNDCMLASHVRSEDNP